MGTIDRDHATKERLRAVANERRESIAELAKALKLNVKSLQVVLSDPNKLISMNQVKACISIGVNANWLLTGEGEMMIDDINNDVITKLETRLRDADNLIDSLERILKGK